MSVDIEVIKKDITRRMEGAVDVLLREFGGLRTGRANTSLLEPLMVVGLGVSVGGIVIALFMPLVALIEAVTGG